MIGSAVSFLVADETCVLAFPEARGLGDSFVKVSAYIPARSEALPKKRRCFGWANASVVADFVAFKAFPLTGLISLHGE